MLNSLKKLKRSRRINQSKLDQSDNASISTTATSTSNSSTTTAASMRKGPKRQSSFASATASSLAHGGPDSSAPPTRSASGNTAGRMPSSKTLSSGDDGNCGGDKENAVNRTPTKRSAKAQKKRHQDSSATPQPVLSPTPYWKVAQERGEKTSPRTTRSAAKRAQQQNSSTRAALAKGMRELDELEEDTCSSSDDDEDDEIRGLDPTTLKFSPPDQKQLRLAHLSPPDRQMHVTMAKNNKKRRDAELERERLRQQKVRKAGMMAMENTKPKGRMAKRHKKGTAAPTSKNEDPHSTTIVAAAAVGPSAEELRDIMEQSLAQHNSANSARIEGLVAKTAAAERDADHYKRRYEEVQKKYDLLEEQAKVKDGSESELQMKCVEQKGMMNEYVREILQCECDKKELSERHAKDIEMFEVEKKRMDDEMATMKEAHVVELQKVASNTASVEEVCNQTQEKYDAALAELELTQTKLAESIQSNNTLEALRASGDESSQALRDQIAELKRKTLELTTQLTTANATIESNQETIASLQTDIATHLTAISKNESAIAQLESDLQAAKKELEDAKRKMDGMQSPRSRDAVKQGFDEEVGDLESKLSTVYSEKTELQEKLHEKDEENQLLKKDLDEAQVDKEELQSQLGEANSCLKEITKTAGAMESENANLLQQVQAANSKYEENEIQLEEMAMENEQLCIKLESTEQEFRQKIQDVESEAQRKERELQTMCDAITAEKESLDTELRQARSDISGIQARVENLEEELTKSQQMTSDLQTEKQASDHKLTELSGQLLTLTNHLESAQAKLRAKEEYCEQFSSIEKKLVQEKHVLNEIRRDLHNCVIQLSGNIRVFVRVRPLIESERQITSQQSHQQSSSNNRRLTSSRPSSASGRPSSRGSMCPSSGRPSSRGSMLPSSSHRSMPSPQKNGNMAVECPFNFPSTTDRNTTHPPSSSSHPSAASRNYTSFNDLTKQTIELTEPYKDRGGLNPRRKKWKYGFDRVFHQDHGQDDVWEGAQPLVQSCIDGFHVCMFAYGQTGSGKTHTMVGSAQSRGLIPRAVAKLFAAKQEIEQSRGGEVSVDLRVELLEIYNEEVRDLLDNNAGPQGQLLKLKLNSNEAVGNVKVDARDETEVAGILKLAQERRQVKATKSNSESSRSHLLFTIHFDVSSAASSGGDVKGRSGCLHIVDLAGSERIDKSGSVGELLTEAKHINTSLSALALVIEKLQAKKSSAEHIPYRDSKLTYLLRNSLGGDSKTLAIVCCSPHQTHFNESLNSIRFAAKASKVELKDANTFDG
mmetsp:Transcript_21474/g.44934  ORF Transcript_21474/g.44934 Transcript_21474/m.44934 type:complete len:1284 (+) Transcript_21474:207-4058(+)